MVSSTNDTSTGRKNTTVLATLDNKNAGFYHTRAQTYLRRYTLLNQQIKRLAQRYYGIAIIATEPIFNDMAASIGLKVHGLDFQLSMMNDEPPSIQAIKQFEDDLRMRRVRVLIYNVAVKNPLTQRLQSFSITTTHSSRRCNRIITTNLTYVEWMMRQLRELDAHYSLL